MAGASNRALKAAGFKPAEIKAIRSKVGGRLNLRSAISAATQHGIAVPDKVHAFVDKRDAKAAKKAPSQPGPMAMRQRKLSAAIEGASRTTLANREAAAAAAKAAPAPKKGGRIAGNIGTLRKLPFKSPINVRATPAVVREYLAPNLAGARATVNRKKRVGDMIHAMQMAAKEATYASGNKPVRSVTFSVNALGEGGTSGTGGRTFNFKARLLAPGADGKRTAAINLISTTIRGESTGGGGAARTAFEDRYKIERSVRRGAGVTREGGALRIQPGDSRTVPFKHRGETVYAVRDEANRFARVVNEQGSVVRNRDAIKRGARVMRAARARSAADRNPAPAVARGVAKKQAAEAQRQATVAADAAVARRAALVSAAGKRKNRVAPTVIMQSAKGVFGVEGSFTYKGQKYRARKTTTSGLTHISRESGGYEQRPVKGLRKRAERVLNASLSRARGSQKDVTFRPRGEAEY